MSGSSIPYHLRPNKAVERSLFVQALQKINGYLDISGYRYIGFGGPFMEDFKIMHNEFKINDMISIEMDDNVRLRQKFNRPVSCINFLDEACNSTEFIEDHDFDKSTLIWLDYVSFSDLATQLNDIRDLIPKLTSGDIFKVTLNAHSPNLGQTHGQDLQTYRLKRFKELVTTDYEPHRITSDDLSAKKFPNTLLKSLNRAIAYGIHAANDLEVFPISAFVYQDGQKMLTATGIILERGEKEKFIEKTRIDQWPFYSSDWSSAKNITLPSLSVRERLLVEQMLPNADYEAIRTELGYTIGNSGKESQELMENFINYYSEFPWFGKVVV